MTKHPLGTVAELGEDTIKGLGGDLIFPDHEDYGDTRNVWNGLANTYPAVIVEQRAVPTSLSLSTSRRGPTSKRTRQPPVNIHESDERRRWYLAGKAEDEGVDTALDETDCADD